MNKVLFAGLSVLAALFISHPAFAGDTSQAATLPASVSVPVVQVLPYVPPTMRIVRDEVCPPVPNATDLWPAQVVSLVGGCQTTSEQQLQYAFSIQLPLMTTETEYQSRINSGYFVRLEGLFLDVRARRPYALPQTVAFLIKMSQAYSAAGCGQLIIMDALRLTTERPVNGSVYSVHPTGMAVDIRTKYIPIECADWLRAYVSQKEAAGEVDGTQELRPEHLHVVVVPLQLPESSSPQVVVSAGAP